MEKISGLKTIENIVLSSVTAIYLIVLFTFSVFRINNICLKTLI